MIEPLGEYPPPPYFDPVLEDCPLAAKTYTHIWRKKDHNNYFRVIKKGIWAEFLIHPHALRAQLMALCRKGLISIDETPTILTVEVVPWDEE